MTKSPRTDTAIRFYIADVDGRDVRWEYVPPAFARQLESDLDAAIMQRDLARRSEETHRTRMNSVVQAEAEAERLRAINTELLAACAAVVAEADKADDWQPWAEQCRAAIAKAQGEAA